MTHRLAALCCSIVTALSLIAGSAEAHHRVVVRSPVRVTHGVHHRHIALRTPVSVHRHYRHAGVSIHRH
jgi:hypothetical protein